MIDCAPTTTDTGPTLFSPLTVRGVTLRNRIGVSPMCQYCCTDGLADAWHLVHLGSRAVGGAGLVMAEATAVTPEGRISPADLGLWSEAHAAALAPVAAFIRRMGAVPGIQLAHAGRKASCLPPWDGGARIVDRQDGAWDVLAPSAIPFSEGEPLPIALDAAGIDAVKEAFVAAAHRAVAAGFAVIELHAAHGYLLHQFLSPLSNHRDDAYGGSLENRMRLPLEIIAALRAVIPGAMPLLVRISATDWMEGGWDLEQSVCFAREMGKLGVDLVDVSSGALVPHARIPVAPGYQVPFAAAIREQAGIRTSAVGLITEPAQAEAIVATGQADMVLLAREMLRSPYWPIQAAAALGCEQPWPQQYGYAVKRR
ncbi:NADH:flavin oxidoreductase/NADH oxidase [Desulfovibrio sp. TomC]|uniref:NADH:flavin oxidoreductase/NADH oxidase n=1 Tax=Desulfovibrio sp. TomC TaxID=1562888 RepID=UPI000574D8DB|nr:NADH:flavin oxidoreductase/NADH oxidase [Desulfovibrio sp. TomC]KHK03051.1 oxidoreductase, FAD/FMN-binding [Desulfovibrio sp. TomC]